MHALELERRFRRSPRLIPSGPKAKDFLYSTPRLLRAPPPAFNVMPYLRLRDQMQEGSCVGNSLSFACESLRNKFRPVDQDSDCSRDLMYRLAQSKSGTLGSDGGASIRGGLDAGVQYGLGRERLYPYTGTYNGTMPDATALADCAPHTLSMYERIDITAAKNGDYVSSIGAIKTALTSGLRVVFGISVPRGMFAINGPMSTHGAQWNWTDPSLNTIMGGHAIVCAGYDDSLYANGYGSCILGNSWGASWGDQGYTAVPWISMLNMAFEVWAIHGFDGYVDSPSVPPTTVTPALRATLFAGLSALGLGAASADGTLWSAPADQLAAVFEYMRRHGQLNTAQVGSLVGYQQADVDGWVAANAAALGAWSQF